MVNRPLKLFISPCPNDTFAFYALLHGAVDTEGLVFDLAFEDIETLNSRATAGDGDIIKASIAVLPAINYELLSAGAALGRGAGPVVVRGAARNNIALLPGEHTTAALLFRRFFKSYTNQFCVFSDIAPTVASGVAEVGVLIHEGRFTYADSGLEFVADLGQMWENSTGLPLPLGGIFANLELEESTRRKVERAIRRSVEWAMQNRAATMDFVRSHARELSETVLQKHIDFFVNEYTIDIGANGRQAIAKILEKA